MKNIKKWFKYFISLALAVWFLIFLVSLITFIIFFETHSLNSSKEFTRSYFHKNIYENKSIPSSIADGLKVALENLALALIITPLSWLMNQLTNIIIFIGSANLLNNLMFHNKDKYYLPVSFWIVLTIAVGLLVIFIFYKLIMIMLSTRNNQSKIFEETFKNILLLIIICPFIPMIFYLLNQILALLLYFIVYKNNGFNLSQLIFNSSFIDKVHNFTYIPSSTSDPNFIDQNNFSFLLCSVSYIFMVYILFVVCKTLILLLIELFWLFITTILIGVSIILRTDNSYIYLKRHNTMIIQRFSIFISIFLAFNIFLSSISIIIHSIQTSSIKLSFSKSFLILFVISSYAFFILEIPILIFNILGAINIIEPFRHSKLLFFNIRKGHSKTNYLLKKTASISKNSFNKVAKKNNSINKTNNEIDNFKKERNIKFKNKNLENKWNDRWENNE